MNKRKKGEEVEKEVERLLPWFKRTARSGAHWDNADLVGPNTIIEVKYKGRSGFSSDKREIDKLRRQADKLGVDWLYIVKDADGDFYVLCSGDFFATIAEGYYSKYEDEEN